MILPGIAVSQQMGIFKETAYIKTYGINEFGRLMFVNDITEDLNGCIILGTTDGITIMDSENRKYITTPSHSGINKLTCDDKGNIFAAGDIEQGFLEFASNGKERFVTISDINSPNRKINNVLKGKNKIFYTDNNTIYTYNYQTINKKTINENILSSFIYKNIPLIITDNSKLKEFNGDTIVDLINLVELKISNPQNVKFLDMGNDSLFLVDNNKLMKIDNTKLNYGQKMDFSDFDFIKLNIPELEKCNINDAKYDRVLRKIAVSTNKGIFILDEKGVLLQTINYATGLPIEDTKNIYFDSKHNLWASLNSVLVKIELSTSTVYYTERQGITGDIYSFQNFNGQYYCSTFNDVYTATSDKNTGDQTIFKKVKFPNSGNKTTYWNMRIFQNHLLICSSDGLYEITGDEAHKLLSTNKIYNIATTTELPNQMLLSSYDGLLTANYSNDNGKLKLSNCKIVKGLDFPIWEIQTDKNGMLWFSSIFNGIYYMRIFDNNIESYTLVNIGKNINFEELRQPRFKVTDKYLYTFGKKLQRAELPEKPYFSAEDINLKCSEIFNQFLDKYESTEVYSLNDKGDVFINAHGQVILAFRDTKQFDTIHFQTKIDMVNNVFQHDSLLFLSTDIGLLKHNMKAKPQEEPSEYPFRTLITGIFANDSTIYQGFRQFSKTEANNYSTSESGTDNLGSSIKTIKFSYTTTCFENSDMTEYSYMLEGLDNKWSEYTNENYQVFGQLSPGNYTFRVRARNHHYKVSSEAVYRFTIERSIFLRWWAIMIYATLLITLVYIPLYRKISRYKKENARLDKLAREQYDEIIRQNERLKLLSLVASKNTNSVMILQPNGNFQWENESFKSIYGYSPYDYKNQHGNNYFEIIKETAQDNYDNLTNIIENKERASFENAHKGPDGNTVYVQTHLDPVFDENGNLINWIVTETNITQLKLAEKETLKQAEKLVEAYSNLMKNQTKMEFQTRQLKNINERLETGYKQIRQQNKTINQSLRYAQNIQNWILPSNEKFAQLIEHFLIYKAKDIVSGDFYMIVKLSEKSFITVVADCTGHGVPGAFMSLIGRSIIYQSIRHKGETSPKNLLEILSKDLIGALQMQKHQNTDGIALSICKFQKEDGYIDMTFAGSASTIYIQHTDTQKLERIKGSRRQIGLNGEVYNPEPFDESTFRINYKDRIFQLSDGIIDQCNKQRLRYGTPRLQNFIERNISTPIAEMGKILEKDLNEFMDGSEQRDDITVLGFSVKEQ